MERDFFLDTDYIRDRKIIIWGIHSPQTKEIVRLLTEKGLEIDFFVDSSIRDAVEKERPIAKIKGLASSHYVIVTMRARHPEVEEFLYENGYGENDDYFWVGQSARRLCMGNGTYHDGLDNQIRIENCEGEAEITITGRGNNISISSCVILGRFKVTAGNRGILNIEETIICNDNAITVRNASVEINDKTKLMGCSITVVASKAVMESSVLCQDSTLEMSSSARLAMHDTYFDGTGRLNRCGGAFINKCAIEKAAIDVSRGANINIKNVALKAKTVACVSNRSKLEIFNSRFDNNADFQCTDRSSVCICNLKGKERLRTAAKERSKVTLEGGNYRENSQIICHHSSEITIGSNYNVNKNFYVIANHGSKVILKEDGMCAENVSIISGDSHPVFDIDNPKEYTADSQIGIDAHVWLGKDCVILSNTKIGEGSIVSPNSVLGREYPNNCIIMGYPARVVKMDVAYSETVVCPTKLMHSKYWNHTQE